MNRALFVSNHWGIQGGARDQRPVLVQFLSFSYSFQEIFGQILGSRPNCWGCRPRKILDPPLAMDININDIAEKQCERLYFFRRYFGN